MDNLRLGVDWDVNEPELKAAMAAAKKDINGVGQTVEEVEKKVKKSISSMASSAANTEGILESLKRKLSELYEQANKATTFAGLHSLNAEIEAYESKISQLTRAGKGGFELQGQAMIQQEGILQRLQRAAALYQKGMLEATREENLEKYSQKLALVNAQIAALTKGQAVGGGWNGLQNSINQISRELPAFTYSVQTGFMAISNNIPILIDELSKARVQNQALVESGKKGIPVWKQLVTSLFSWQTAMSLGITLMTIYGKEIGAWVAGLFKASSALDKLKKSNEEFRATQLKGAQDGQRELVSLQQLYAAARNTNLAYSERKKAVDALQAQYPKYFKNLNDEAIIAGRAQGAYEKLAKAIVAAATARAYEDKIAEKSKTQLENIDKIVQLQEKYNEADAKLQASQGKLTSRNITGRYEAEAIVNQIEASRALRDEAGRELNDLAKANDQLDKEKQRYGAAVQNIVAKNGVETLTGLGGKDAKDTSKSIIKERQSLLDKIAEIDAEYARKSFTKDEEELQALRDKFKKIRTEVERFNANPKNKNVRIDLQGLSEIQGRAEEDLIYRQQTERLKKEIGRAHV